MTSPTASQFDPNMSSAERIVWMGGVFRSVDWLIPAYTSVGFIETLARVIEKAEDAEKLQILQETMRHIYSPQHISVMYLERYSKVIYVKEFAKQLDECFRAFFAGLRSVAITAIIPILEGIIRKMALALNRNLGSGTQGIVREFKALVEEEKTSAQPFGERVVMFELLAEFIENKFLRSTNRYDGLQNFNRHGILHGVFSDFGEELNFLRCVMLLDLIIFAIGYRSLDRVSVFAPEMTDESRVLAADYLRSQPGETLEQYSQPAAVLKMFMRIAAQEGLVLPKTT